MHLYWKEKYKYPYNILAAVTGVYSENTEFSEEECDRCIENCPYKEYLIKMYKEHTPMSKVEECSVRTAVLRYRQAMTVFTAEVAERGVISDVLSLDSAILFAHEKRSFANTLKKNGLFTVEDVTTLTKKDVARANGLSTSCADTLQRSLERLGLSLANEFPNNLKRELRKVGYNGVIPENFWDRGKKALPKEDVEILYLRCHDRLKFREIGKKYKRTKQRIYQKYRSALSNMALLCVVMEATDE